MIKPQYVLPIHSEPEVTKMFCQMAQGLGYINGETCITLKNGQTLKLES
jgi:mRNA degradation ribonuclease J1/J2